MHFARGSGAIAATIIVTVALLLITTDRAVIAEAKVRRPNVVVIQTDDQMQKDLYSFWRSPSGSMRRVMPNTVKLIGQQGVTLDRFYASYPLCGPSRSTLLSGQYSHNTGVLTNGGAKGGWDAYQSNPIYSDNLATRLQDGGYSTIHLGKFLNGYGTIESPALQVPPGWDRWESVPTSGLFYGYVLNRNGSLEGPLGDPDYGPFSGRDDPLCPDQAPIGVLCNNLTDVMTARAVDQVGTAPGNRPFYMQVDYSAPHGDFRPPIGPEPAARHYDSAFDTSLPRRLGFNEADISDKPSFLRDNAPSLTQTQISALRAEYQKTIESLRGVDDGVGKIVAELKDRQMLSNTYVIFASDNGYFHGEHRIERSKFLPYEPSSHIPFLVRGPGIKRGTHSKELFSNADIAPSVLSVADLERSPNMDGRSMLPFWKDNRKKTRRPILLESFARGSEITNPSADRQLETRSGAMGRGATASISAPINNYAGIVAGPYKYVEYAAGDQELYDLTRDPGELNNRIHNSRYNPVRNFLRIQLDRLRACKRGVCRSNADEVPTPRRQG